MVKDIYFEFKKGNWHHENEIIENCDLWLNRLSNDNNKFYLRISDKGKLREKLVFLKENNNAADYLETEYKEKVTLPKSFKILFGEFPTVIYYQT